MIIPCGCPGQVKFRRFKVIFGRGQTGGDATADLTVKVSKMEVDFKAEFDRWARSVRCGGDCGKKNLFATSKSEPTKPEDFGKGIVTVCSVSAFGYVFCKPLGL